MKTAQIKGKLKWSADPLQGGRVPDQKFCLNSGFAGLLRGELDGARREIDTGHLPTRAGKCDDVCACATAYVDGAAGFVVLDKVKEFRWTDARIPWRLPKIPVMEKEAAEQVLHFFYECQAADGVPRGFPEGKAG